MTHCKALQCPPLFGRRARGRIDPHVRARPPRGRVHDCGQYRGQWEAARWDPPAQTPRDMDSADLKFKRFKKNVDVPRRDPKKQACTTYNTHRSSDGCYWESQNRGETCVYDHYCSWCKEHKSVIEKHQAFNCPHKSD